MLNLRSPSLRVCKGSQSGHILTRFVLIGLKMQTRFAKSERVAQKGGAITPTV